jgi:LysM repeat protein
MKNNRLINHFLILITWLSCLSLSAQQISDAAFIKIEPKLGKVIYHRVLKTETLYAVARGYGVTTDDIIKVNPALKGKTHQKLPPILSVPISNDHIVTRIPLFKNKREYLPVYYQVQKKDNLFRISRVYFNIPTNLLVNRNNIEEEKLSVGQTLQIGWLKRDFEPLLVHTGNIYEDDEKVTPEKSSPVSDYEVKFREALEGTNLIDKNEVAFWKESEGAKGFFVMHRHAAQSSIIEVTNPMVGTSIYAKVIGTIPQHLYPKEIDMVISKDMAASLGAVDHKFFVRSRYMSSRSVSSR